MREIGTEQFSLAITSDPQYPWYDEVLPPGLTTEDQIKENSHRQIKAQYEAINQLGADSVGSAFPLEGVVLNGDLTAFGHGWQLDTYKELVARLAPKFYPALGNHDYANNVDDCSNNGCATAMVKYMRDWIMNNQGHLDSHDYREQNSYHGELRTDLSGSLAYSLNLDRVHLVVLHNFPSYADSWDSWEWDTARRLFITIQPSFYWLAHDLALARNRGDAILVFLHDYNDNFLAPERAQFDQLMSQYGVSGVFAGHIHPSCERIHEIPSPDGVGIPVYRSGAASYQDFLVAEIDMAAASKTLTVTKYEAPDPGSYGPTANTWTSPLRMDRPDPPLPVPPREGHVTFFNDGGFHARFRLRYKDAAGLPVSEETGTLRLGNKKTYDIPAYATEIELKGEEQTGLVWEGWRTVFNLNYASPPNQCFRLYNTTLNPKWDNKC